MDYIKDLDDNCQESFMIEGQDSEEEERLIKEFYETKNKEKLLD